MPIAPITLVQGIAIHVSLTDMRCLPTETLRFANWVFNPGFRGRAEEVYTLLGDRALTDETRYLNLGDWEGAEDVDTACRQLVHRVGTAADLGPGDRVLDVGFGFGAQDVYWMTRFAPREIVGVNITGPQVAAARRRVAAAGLADRIHLYHASATELPLPDQAFDVVVALECAFHFRTRERFFSEAHRVLRPGGRLVTADIIPRAGALDRPSLAALGWHFVATRFDMPRVNAYPASEYRRRLRGAGFSQAEVASIRDRVYAPLQRALTRDRRVLARQHPLARLPFQLASRVPPERVFAAFDYVIAVAER